MGFGLLDVIIVVTYLAGMAVLGVVAGGKQTSGRDYFLGKENIPWWAVCFAIVATETSTLTFISIPALAYATNLNFLQVTFGYILGRIAVSILLLPSYSRGELVTAYQLLARRFGPRMRSTASITFMVTRVLADGVRLYATAIPLALLFRGWNLFEGVAQEQIYVAAILILAGITILYTYIGGVRAVIWTDVVQMFIYLVASAGALLVIAEGGAFAGGVPPEKLQIFRSGFDLPLSDFFRTAYTLPAGLLGGAFLSMASHGTDQIIVQRLLTVGSLRGSQKALITSGVLVVLQFALFLVIGLGLFSFYGGASLRELGLSRGDEIFPAFIIDSIPSGLSGLIIAGLLAAAMSTLSGSVNSLASATIHDLYLPSVRRQVAPLTELRLSRLASLFWSLALVGVALFFIAGTSAFLVELALGIASVTYGGLLGTFLLGVLFRRPGERDAMVGFITGIAVMSLLFFATQLAWTWFTVAGTVTTLIAGWISSTLRGQNSR